MANPDTGLSTLFRSGLRLMETAVEAVEIEIGPRAAYATPNTVVLELKTMRLRDYSTGREGTPILVHAPFAGHSSAIADFHHDQSLMACLKEHAGGPLYLTDWKGADAQTQAFTIDEYLAELVVAIDHIGGRAHVAGLCQGGWAAAMLAARFPEKVASLVLAGAPLDLMAGDGWIKRMVQTMPPAFYQQLVFLGGGRLRGQTMLQGFKAMHPFEQYVERYIRLYEHIDDAEYRRRLELFSAWYEHPIDLPGPWYLQVVDDLFRKNLFYEGRNEEMRHEPTFVNTVLHRSAEDPGLFMLHETWRDRADFFSVQMKQPYRARYEARLPDLLRAPREMQVFLPLRADSGAAADGTLEPRLVAVLKRFYEAEGAYMNAGGEKGGASFAPLADTLDPKVALHQSPDLPWAASSTAMRATRTGRSR